MRSLNSLELFQVWEAGLDQSLLEKTLRLLSVACSVEDINQLGRLSIGERDARLLYLREWTFGPRLKNKAQCPRCAETVEWETNIEALQLQSFSPELSFRTFVLEKDEYIVQFRLPDSHDIARALSVKSNGSDSREILSGCILEISRNGKEYNTNDLPGEVWDLMIQQMALEDPQADIRMNINCPACSHRWEASFDIVSYIWAEINSWAQRVIGEVCLLARSFGWSEKDILSMSAHRRQLYIEMLRV